MTEWSQTWNWVDGEWLEGNPLLMGPRTHASWLASSVFDGARYFEGVMPDLDLHCQRVNDSAVKLNLKPTMKAGEIAELAKEGVKKFAPEDQIYIKPMYWSEADGPHVIAPNADSTRFCLCLFEAAMGPADAAMSISVSPFRRPSLESMPTDAKAGCLYPNNARATLEADSRGFDSALVLDMMGNVAELTSSNAFMVKDGALHTSYPNGTFLNGITRQRIIYLARKAGIPVYERILTYKDFYEADEIFSTGNYSKLTYVNRIDDRKLEPGKISQKLRELYWEYAHEDKVTPLV